MLFSLDAYCARATVVWTQTEQAFVAEDGPRTFDAQLGMMSFA
jgi:hypothetical protein